MSNSPSPQLVRPSLHVEQENSSRVVLGGVLCLVFILVRGQGLLALPIFSDEAIYLRWAQLVRAGYPWVSLVDPKPPLHFWMLAGVQGWSRDPLLAARGLSVFAGVLSIPAMMLVCDEVGLLQQERRSAGRAAPAPSGRILGFLTAVLMIFCPFLAFYQRLATADALFVAEMLVAVWVGLRWGRRVTMGQRAWPTALALGMALGVAMMTRQGLSYTLWGIPLAGVFLHTPRGLSRKRWMIVLAQFLLAAVVAALLWLPYLTNDLARYTENARSDAPLNAGTLNELSIIKQRILYQDQFTQSQTSRMALAAHNIGNAYEWFKEYLTWPVFVASVLGFAAIVFRRQWRILLLLLLWVAFMLGPVILLGNVVYSRYVLAGVPVLLIGAAYFVAEILALALSVRLSPVLTWPAAGAIVVAVLLFPFRQLGLQATAWWRQELTVADEEQYVTGWTNGLAARKALKFIEGYAAEGGGVGKVVLITDNGWGLPADAAWVYLEHSPTIQLYYKTGARSSSLLAPAADGSARVLLRKDKWLYTPEQAVEIPPEASVLFLTECHGSEESLLRSLREFTPNLKLVLSFYGIDTRGDADHVVLFEVK